MRYLVLTFAFFLSMSASAQLLKTEESIKLPIALSLLEYKNIQAHFNNINNLKPYTFSIDELDKMRRGNFVISTKNINKNFTFLELPSIDLKKELNKIMHKVPGLDTPVRAEGFTL